jgi:isopentenyl diphosphate isomerase/L-lactate dehydrogenase-like FMN-dependent dehydrogenase
LTKATHDNATGDPVCEFEALARDRMEPSAYDYHAGAAADERTLAENRLGFDRVVFRPRVLIDVTRIDLSSELLGQSVSFGSTGTDRLQSTLRIATAR